MKDIITIKSLVLRILKDMKIYNRLLFLSGYDNFTHLLENDPLHIISSSENDKGWTWSDSEEKWLYWSRQDILLLSNIIDKLDLYEIDNKKEIMKKINSELFIIGDYMQDDDEFNLIINETREKIKLYFQNETD